MADELKDSVLFRRYPTSVIPSVPIVDGQILFEVTQSRDGKIYYDYQGKRQVLGGSYLSTYTITLPTSGWSSTAPYTQTVTVAGVTQYDKAIPVLNQGSIANETAQRNAMMNFSYITYYDINDGNIKATAPFTKPNVDLKVDFIGQ